MSANYFLIIWNKVEFFKDTAFELKFDLGQLYPKGSNCENIQFPIKNTTIYSILFQK